VIASLKRHKWLWVLAAVLIFGILFVLAGFFHALTAAPGTGSISWRSIGLLAAFLASLGALYGSVVVLDQRSGMAVGHHPFWRVVLAAVFGAATVFIVWSWNPGNFDVAWSAGGFVIGAILGWYGWRWARYVDF
jgi:hypothetical protein